VLDDWSERAPLGCDPAVYACVAAWYGHNLFRNWTDASRGSAFAGARMLLATVRHPVPLFDDSYAVNSASLEPYGDAINYELLPEVERRFHGLGQGWARGVFFLAAARAAGRRPPRS
jgi:hypothetical protein